MRGFKKGAKPPKAKNYANGGKVQGPGTGTSDDVQAQVPAGSYVMPADSTEQIGADQLQAMGKGAPVDVNLSDGEQVLPPDQVHAIGVQALDAMKGATHAPVPQPAARGFRPQAQPGAEPEMFFANGGEVEDPRKKQTSFDITNTPAAQRSAGVAQPGYSPSPVVADAQATQDAAAQRQAVTGASSAYSPDPAAANAQAAEDRMAQRVATQPLGDNPERAARMQAQMNQPVTSGAPAQPQQASGFMPQYRTEGSGYRTDSVLRGTGDDVAEQWGRGEYARGAGTLVRGTLAAVPAAFMDAGEDLYNVAGKPAVNFGKGLFGIQDDPVKPAAATPATPAAAAATPAAPAAASPAATPASATPAGAMASAAAAAPQGNGYQNTGIAGIVGKKDANGQYSFTNEQGAVAGASGNLAMPNRGGTFSVIGGGQEAMQRNLRAADILSQGQPRAAGFPAGGGLTIIPDSSRGDAERQQLINAASTPYRGSPGGQLTANQLRTLAGIQENDGRNALARETNAANLTREQMQQQGADNRAAMQEQGQNARFAATNDLDRQRTGAELEARGFQTRAAQRQEALYQKYETAKTPEERTAIGEQIRALAGKEPQNRFTVVAGGQEVDPVTQQLVTRPARVFNNQTGQFVDQQGQPAQAVSGIPQPKTAAEYEALPKGAQYMKDGQLRVKG